MWSIIEDQRSVGCVAFREQSRAYYDTQKLYRLLIAEMDEMEKKEKKEKMMVDFTIDY
jgi:hypothetical protein